MPRAKKVRGVTRVAPGVFRVRVRALNPATGKEVSRFETLEGAPMAAAVARKAELLAELQEELRGPAKPEVQTFRTYATSWLDATLSSLAHYTGTRYASDLEAHILPQLGDKPVSEITGLDIRTWQAEAARKLKPNGQPYSAESVAGWFRIFHTVLNAAVADGVIPFNPAAHIRPVRSHAPEQRRLALTPAELGQVLALAREHEPAHHAFLATLALTGVRHGEAAALQWDDISEADGVIHIQRSATRGVVGVTKTRKTRVVGLSPALRDILRDHRRELIRQQHPGLAEGWVFPVLGKVPPGASPDTPPPVTLRYHTVLSKPLARLLKKAGITRHVSVHGLRRSHVDALRRVGVDAVVEHATVGHSGDRMREHYSHVGHDERRVAAEGVARLVLASESSVPQSTVEGELRDANGSQTGVEGV